MSVSVPGPSRDVLEPLAQAWLRDVRGFGLWHGAHPVHYWPPEGPPTLPDLDAPLAGCGDGWRLGVCGVPEALRPHASARLAADAALAARIAQGDAELDLLTEQLVERQDELLALYELARSARSTLDLPVTLQSLAHDGARLLHSPAGFVACTTPDASMIVALEPPLATEAPAAADPRVAEVERFAAQVQTQGRELVLTEPPGAAFLGHRHVLAAPIRVGHEVRAVIGMARDDQPFVAADVKLARAIAEQAGAQIENALLHEDRLAQARLQAEMQFAARVQSDLLPHAWPAIRGLDACAQSRPASLVGGDFYDAISLDADGLFVVVGDVSGKGVPAALVMAMTRAVLRGAVRSTPLPAADHVLRLAVGALYDDFTRLEMFATTFLARYSGLTRALHYINAGHAPVVYRPSRGTPLIMEPDEPPIGMLADTTAREHVVPLQPGDLLVVATDGFNEARAPDGELFGYERLLSVIDRHADATASAIAQALVSEVTTFQRGRLPDDDQTLLVLKGTAG